MFTAETPRSPRKPRKVLPLILDFSAFSASRR
jgi:hypothetical protein